MPEREWSENLIKFGRAVKERREALGLSQEKLAAHSGLHRTYISDLERGNRNVSLQNILRLSEALSTTASELLSIFTRED